MFVSSSRRLHLLLQVLFSDQDLWIVYSEICQRCHSLPVRKPRVTLLRSPPRQQMASPIWLPLTHPPANPPPHLLASSHQLRHTNVDIWKEKKTKKCCLRPGHTAPQNPLTTSQFHLKHAWLVVFVTSPRKWPLSRYHVQPHHTDCFSI